VSARLRNAVLAISVGALTGCELIAGIKDLQVGLISVDDGGVPPTDGSIYGQKDGATSRDGRSSDAGSTTFDATESETAAGDAAADTQSATDDVTIADVTVPDGTTDAPINLDSGAVDSSAPPDGSYSTVLIDDMANTGGHGIGWLDGPGVAGTWYVFDDGSDGGVLTPVQGSPAASVITAISGGPGSSTHAAHVSGNAGFIVYGGGMGFNLNSPSSPGVYDASAHAGFTFYARALGDAGPTTITFNVLDHNTAPPSSGGICDGGNCNGYYGSAQQLTSAWTQITIRYTDLVRPVWAKDAGLSLDSAQMIGCQFQSNPGVAFDLWITDISFIDQ
jgi:hypothetical protein